MALRRAPLKDLFLYFFDLSGPGPFSKGAGGSGDMISYRRIASLDVSRPPCGHIGCVAVWLRGCVAGWLCGCVAMWLRGYVAMWLCGYVAMWLCGYVVLVLTV